jgi:hypothetical protein
MARMEKLLELLNTLILSSMDKIDIATLTDVLTCLQYSREKIEFL